MVSNFQLGRLEEAIKLSARIIDSQHPMPERYKAMAQAIYDEAKFRYSSELGQIVALMDASKNRLENKAGGPETQRIQDEIVKRLDKMIEETENQANSDSSGEAPKSSTPEKIETPSIDSKIMGDSGPGKVDNKKLKKDGKVVGSLPEKDKIKALQSIDRVLPPHYREAIEGYTKKIAEGNLTNPKKGV